MSIESVAKGYIDGELERIANEIKADMVNIVSQHSRSGKAVSAIQLEKTSSVSYFIGAHVPSNASQDDGRLHLLYLNDGNGGTKRTITAKHTGRNGRAGALGKWNYGIPGIGWRTSVQGYDGIDFVGDIAKKYR